MPGAAIDQEVKADVAGGTPWAEVPDIPTRVTAPLTETSLSDGWRFLTIEPDHVQITPGPPIEVDVTNERETGGIRLTKSLSGPVDGASTTFSAFLDCHGEAYDQPVPVTLNAGIAETVTISGIRPTPAASLPRSTSHPNGSSAEWPPMR